MGRRSASNERYQKHTSPSGKTRKSAAAAKPKRAIGKPSASASKSKTTTKTKAGKIAVVHPTTPEYKRIRLIWWGFLGGSVVLSTAAFFMWKQPDLQKAGNYVLAAAYALIFVAIYLDWSRLRPMRTKWMESGKTVAEKELAKTGKPEASTAEKSDKTDADSTEGSSADKKS